MRTLIGFAFAVGASAVLAFTLLNIGLPRSAHETSSSGSPLLALDSALADSEPDRTLADILDSLPRTEWNLAVTTVAGAWAHRDPRAAMAHVDALPDEVRASFIDGVTGEWALADPDDFLDYARSQGRIDHLRNGLATALIVVPEQMLDIVAAHPSVQIGPQRTLEEAAVVAVTERDAMMALAYLDTLAPERQLRVRGLFAETWARRNPDDALSWAEGLQPPAPGVVARVIAYTAVSDVEAALNLLEFFDAPEDHPDVLAGVATPQAIARTIVRQIASNPDREQIADRLLRRRTPHSLIALEELATHWTLVDAAAAAEWVIRAADRLPPELPISLARQRAATDAEEAAAFADQLPTNMRLLLAREIAPALARHDPFAAANWLEQFQEHADYTDLYRRALRAAVVFDAASAAEMLSSTPPATELRMNDTAIRLEGEVAMAWANQDLASASAWVQGIADPAGRAAGVIGVASYWLRADPHGAQQWVLGLPPDESRRNAIYAMAMQAADLGYELDAGFVRAYGREPEEQNIIRNWVLQAARRDPRKAQPLVDEWITDPEIQRQTAEAIESMLDRYSLTPAD